MTESHRCLTRYRNVEAYTTRDGSQIRELKHPTHHGNANQSLAEAVVAPGTRTRLHRHHATEEIYHVTAGTGSMRLGDEQFPVQAGDTVHIAPGTPHCLDNPGPEPLRVLCCCAPPYSHQDTELLAE